MKLFERYPRLESGRLVLRRMTGEDVEQFVMAYGVEQDRIRALLPDGYESLRAVLRINAEIRDGEKVYIELNTPVACGSRRGWLNIANWKSTNDPGISFEREGKTTCFSAPFLSLEFTGTGALGGCPAEKDNQGCFYLGNDVEFRPAEKIDAPREYCRCSFAWRFREGDARGKSADEGRSLAAKSDLPKIHYEPCECTAENAAAIPCEQVLGAYTVRFVREPVG